MQIEKKLLYVVVTIIGVVLVVGSAFGLRMKNEAESYKRLSSEHENKVANLEQRAEEREEAIRNIKKEGQEKNAELTQKQNQLRKQLQAAQAEKNRLDQEVKGQQKRTEKDQKRLTEITQARDDLQRRHQILVAEVQELKTRTGELLTGKSELIEAKGQGEERLRDQQKLIGSLRDEIAAGQVKIAEFAGNTTIRLEDRILFDSSMVAIKTSGLAVLTKVGEALQQIHGRHIQVQGHTDSRPIRWELQGKYPTNWELSVARASSIVRYLVEEVGIEPTRLSAAGYAFYQPVASNDTPEGRQVNRRVEFVLFPR